MSIKNINEFTSSGSPDHAIWLSKEDVKKIITLLLESCTRRRAVADGKHFDVTSMARRVGFYAPAFITAGVKRTCVEIPEGVEGQDEEGRLWYVLWTARCSATALVGDSDRILFRVLFRNSNQAASEVEMLAVCSALDIDDPTPALTIMLLEESKS